MDPSFWHDRWNAGEIGFHEGRVNALLEQHFSVLNLAAHGRIFLPLCGKSMDIAWLLHKGHAVVGAELSDLAITQLFDELGLTPEIADTGPLRHYRAQNLDIHVGDIFDLDRGALGDVDAVVDRAALVALPGDMRLRYARHLMVLTARAPQLLITFDYDQSAMDGPPFSVDAPEVMRHYAADYAPVQLMRAEVAGGLKGKHAARETIWHLIPR